MKKTYEHIFSDGRILFNYSEEKKSTIEEKVEQEVHFMDNLLKKITIHNQLKMQIDQAVTDKNFIKFKEALEAYLEEQSKHLKNDDLKKPLSQKEINKKQRINTIELLLDICQDKNKNNINTWISYIKKGEYIADKNLVLCLYITEYKKQAIKYLKNNNKIDISSEYYDNFADVFEKYIKTPVDVYSRQDKEKHITQEKETFFNEIMKAILASKLESTLTNNEVKNKRNKI